MFDTVDELIAFAQDEYDNENSDYFNDDDEHCILVGTMTQPQPSDVAPSLDWIADTMNDQFYSEYNLDDDADVQILRRKEADEAWRKFCDEYFELPCKVVCHNDVGWYDLKEQRWTEKYKNFPKEG